MIDITKAVSPPLILGELMTTKQLAEFLKISVSSLEKQRSQNPKAPPSFIKVGRAVRYRVEDISRWLDDQKSTLINQS
ncbi:MAG: helix-turn-helix domain-containing protein [Methylobacter sp.]|nr:helix-turn-helix domain-containing protein [Candidatus Methylobacter titanis]